MATGEGNGVTANLKGRRISQKCSHVTRQQLIPCGVRADRRQSKVKVVMVIMTSWVLLSASMPTAAARESYLACYNTMMDRTLCSVGYQIQIETAYFVDDGSVRNCDDASDPSDMCKAYIFSTNPGYYREILNKCNGLRACSDLMAAKEHTHCNGWINRKTDYVLLYYDCAPVSTTTPATTTTTTPATTTTTTPATTTTTTPATTTTTTPATTTTTTAATPTFIANTTATETPTKILPSTIEVTVPETTVTLSDTTNVATDITTTTPTTTTQAATTTTANTKVTTNTPATTKVATITPATTKTLTPSKPSFYINTTSATATTKATTQQLTTATYQPAATKVVTPILLLSTHNQPASASEAVTPRERQTWPPPSEQTSSAPGEATSTGEEDKTLPAKDVTSSNVEDNTHGKTKPQIVNRNIGYMVAVPVVVIVLVIATILLILLVRRKKRGSLKIACRNQTSNGSTLQTGGATNDLDSVPIYPAALYRNDREATLPPGESNDNYIYDEPCRVRTRPVPPRGGYVAMGSTIHDQNTNTPTDVTGSRCHGNGAATTSVYSLERASDAAAVPRRPENEYISMENFAQTSEPQYAEVKVKVKVASTPDDRRQLTLPSPDCEDDLIVLDNPLYGK